MLHVYLRFLQAGVLALTGAGVGGGFGVQTWQPFLCVLFSHDPNTVYWTQLATVPCSIAFGGVAALLSIPLSRVIWTGTAVCA